MLYVNKFVVNGRSKLSFSVKTLPSYDAAWVVLKLTQLTHSVYRKGHFFPLRLRSTYYWPLCSG